MTSLKLLGVAAIAASALTTAAMAQAVVNNPGRCQAEFPNANCQNLGPGNPYTDNGYRHRGRRVAYRHGRAYDNDWNRRHSGFWPADVAGAAVGTAGAIAGAAVGTAGAIATAPSVAGTIPMPMPTAPTAGITAPMLSATASSARRGPGSRVMMAAATAASRAV